jgi:broad specificity phosphatase PhoE
MNSNNLSALDINSNTIKNITLSNNNLVNQNISCDNKKLVIFIRHARSISNDTKNFLIRNTDLCQQGYEQAKILADKLYNFNNYLKTQTQYSKGIELAIISPLKRTLLTAVPTLEKLPDINVETSFLCTENAVSPSSVGFSTVEEFKEFNNSVINRNIKVNETEYAEWSKLIWNNYISDIILIHKRKKLFDEFIRSRNEKVIIVFSHGNFLKLYFDHILDDNKSYDLSLDNTHFIPVYL